MSEKKDSVQTNSYTNIFKATSLFAGVQVFQILINIIKSKVIAVLLGPTGVGIQGLYQSATEMVKQLTSFGIAQSAVRDVSESNDEGRINKVERTVGVVKRLVWITGLLGGFSVIVFSPILSKLSFGSRDNTTPFIFLGITLLFDQLCAGQKVVLQGLRKLKYLAKASVLGSAIGLIVSIPIYNFFGIKGIVPCLIINSLTALLLSWYYSRKIEITPVNISVKESIKEGKTIIKLGFALSISSILVAGCSYILRGFIRSIGGAEEVGFYTAGFIIINTYVSMVFNAMGTDYFPRLAAINKDNNKCKQLVNQQGEIGLLIIAPLLSACIVFMPIMIIILYSHDFLPANNYIQYATIGMMFKIVSWSISYQFIAKGDSKVFIINEVCLNSYTLVLDLMFYHFLGLKGLGLSFVIVQLLYLIQVFLVARAKYSFGFSNALIKLFIIQAIVVVATLLLAITIHNWTLYVFGSIAIVLSSSFSIKELNKRIDLKALFHKR